MALRDIVDAFTEDELIQLAEDVRQNRVERAREERITAAINAAPEAEFVAAAMDSPGLREVIEAMEITPPSPSVRDIVDVAGESTLEDFAEQIEAGEAAPIIESVIRNAVERASVSEVENVIFDSPGFQQVFNALEIEPPDSGPTLAGEAQEEAQEAVDDPDPTPDISGVDDLVDELLGGVTDTGPSRADRLPEAPNTDEVLQSVAERLETKFTVVDRPAHTEQTELDTRFPTPQIKQAYIKYERDRRQNQQTVLDPATYWNTFGNNMEADGIVEEEWLAAQQQRFIFNTNGQ